MELSHEEKIEHLKVMLANATDIQTAVDNLLEVKDEVFNGEHNDAYPFEVELHELHYKLMDWTYRIEQTMCSELAKSKGGDK